MIFDYAANKKHVCRSCRKAVPWRPTLHVSPEEIDSMMARDKRAKYWKAKVYFWQLEEPVELIAESDSYIVHGTNEILTLIEGLCEELYGKVLPELRSELTRHALLQVRINLSNRGKSTMRIAYDFRHIHHGVQVDIWRVENKQKSNKHR